MNRNQLDNIFARLEPMLVLHQDGLGLDDLLSRVAAPSLRLGRFERPEHETFSAKVAGHAPNHPQTTAGPDDDAVILFTSGTSARPKGVMLNYREHLANIGPAAEGFGITADAGCTISVPSTGPRRSSWARSCRSTAAPPWSWRRNFPPAASSVTSAITA